MNEDKCCLYCRHSYSAGSDDDMYLVCEEKGFEKVDEDAEACEEYI